jgi:hypothetical protein
MLACLQTRDFFWVFAMGMPLLVSLAVPFLWPKPEPQSNNIIWSVLTMNAYVAVALANVLETSSNAAPGGVDLGLGKDLWTILTLAVALGAYTSTILISLHGKIRSAKDEITKCNNLLKKCPPSSLNRELMLQERRRRAESSRDRYSADRDWLVWADFLVAVISLVVICAIIQKDLSPPACYTYQLVIDGLFLALIAYFITLHLRQWVIRHSL